jgi:hypothetical protein
LPSPLPIRSSSETPSALLRTDARDARDGVKDFATNDGLPRLSSLARRRPKVRGGWRSSVTRLDLAQSSRVSGCHWRRGCESDGAPPSRPSGSRRFEERELEIRGGAASGRGCGGHQEPADERERR